MPDQYAFNPTTGRTELVSVGPITSAADVKAAQDAVRLGTTAGKGLGALAKPMGGMPKPKPNEEPADYAARVRQWREDQQSPIVAGQKAALQKMGDAQ